MTVACLLKRVPLRIDVDPLTGELAPDPHGGLSTADRTALELAVQCGDALAVSVGGPECDEVLREALAAGASRAIRVDAHTSGWGVAQAVAPLLADCRIVFCGDHSLDNGSGSVPAFLAAELGFQQALGLTGVDLETMTVVRRLDGGRKELLAITGPAVLSVEAGVVPLRRPSLLAVLAAGKANIEVVPGVAGHAAAGRISAYRPRARQLPGPDPSLSARERLLTLSGALVQREPPRVVHADPDAAAQELLDFLTSKGYL